MFDQHSDVFCDDPPPVRQAARVRPALFAVDDVGGLLESVAYRFIVLILRVEVHNQARGFVHEPVAGKVVKLNLKTMGHSFAIQEGHALLGVRDLALGRGADQQRECARVVLQLTN